MHDPYKLYLEIIPISVIKEEIINKMSLVTSKNEELVAMFEQHPLSKPNHALLEKVADNK